MSREKKFNFISVTQIMKVKEKADPKCSFNLKTSFISFLSANPDIDQYRNRFVKLYVDARKNSVAWKFIENGEKLADSEGIAQIKDFAGGLKLYVPKRLVQLLDVRPGIKYVSMPIGKYQDSVLDDKPFYYITLENPPTEGLREVVEETNE